MVGEPRVGSSEMPLYSQCGPIFQFLVYIIIYGPGLQPKGVTGKVNAIAAVVLWNIEPLAKVFQGILEISLLSKLLCILEDHLNQLWQ